MVLGCLTLVSSHFLRGKTQHGLGEFVSIPATFSAGEVVTCKPQEIKGGAVYNLIALMDGEGVCGDTSHSYNTNPPLPKQFLLSTVSPPCTDSSVITPSPFKQAMKVLNSSSLTLTINNPNNSSLSQAVIELNSYS